MTVALSAFDTADLRIGSLFSGIGLLDLGLERAGLGSPVWFAEIDPYARAVLRRHWPTARLFQDVREVDREADEVDVVAGGFPCQPISAAGRMLGERDPRWLWPEFARVIGECRPRIVVAENVPPLRSRGLRGVLADLARLGFDAEWATFRASDLGAPHERNRIWIVAWDRTRVRADAPPGWLDRAARSAASDTHAEFLWDLAERRSEGRSGELRGRGEAEPAHDGSARSSSDSDGGRGEPRPDGLRERLAESPGCPAASDSAPDGRCAQPIEPVVLAVAGGARRCDAAPSDSADPDSERGARSEGVGRSSRPERLERGGGDGSPGRAAPDSDGEGQLQPEGRFGAVRGWARDSGWRDAPPAVRGVDDGSSEGLELVCDAPGGCRGEACDHERAPDSFRVAGLGNGVVVQCAELVGRSAVTNLRAIATRAA